MHPCPWTCAPFIESHRSGPCKWWFMSQMVITQIVFSLWWWGNSPAQGQGRLYSCDWPSHKGEKWSHLMKLISYVHKLGWAWLIWIPPNRTIWLVLLSDPSSILITEKVGACGSTEPLLVTAGRPNDLGRDPHGRSREMTLPGDPLDSICPSWHLLHAPLQNTYIK